MDADNRDDTGEEAGGSRVHRRYTTAQLCRLLNLPPDRLRRWIRQGLIKPVEASDGVSFFDFQQVTAVKTLAELTQAGVPLAEIRRSLDRLRDWLPGNGAEGDDPLANLPVIERDGRLLVRLEEGQLAEPSGQLQLDFVADADVPKVVCGSAASPSIESISADDWWDRGSACEEQGKLIEAENAYRQALLLGGPNPVLCLNLGNVLYAQGKKEQAAERFQQAVELDAAFAEAWNNLGNALAELNRHEEALTAYRQALKSTPHFADGHFNLADTLDRLGRQREARPHWQTYISLDPAGPWADYARKKLNARPAG